MPSRRATASAVAVLGLRALGAAAVDYLVPNRFEDGYGLTPEIVRAALAHPRLGRPDLLVTVDNGIASVEGVAAARAAGLSVLVTDHHLPGEALPAAEAIVNPNQPGCGFPSKHLAGVGVMFYVLVALFAGPIAQLFVSLPRAVVITGAGRGFCAGRDISAVVPAEDDATAYLRDRVTPVLRAMSEIPVPTFAAVQGACLGVGLGLAIATRQKGASAVLERLAQDGLHVIIRTLRALKCLG